MRTLLFALAAVAALATIVTLAPEAEATHYRWGVLSWEPTETANEVKFTGNHGWRRSAFSYPNVGDTVETGVLYTGDGGAVTLRVRVTTISETNDWFIGKFVDGNGVEGIRYQYGAPNNGGQPWVAYFESCCRISPYSSGNFHVNNPDHDMRLETHVDLSVPNSSPKTILPPINQCPIEDICTIRVPVTDNDADQLFFRLSTPFEAEGAYQSFAQPGPPHAANAATIDAQTGVITWDTHGATYDPNYHTLYSMAIMVEDGHTKTPLDFFVELLAPGVSPPYWVSPPTTCDAVRTTGHGGLVTFDVRAASDDPERIVSINHLGLPEGATFVLPAPGNPVTGTFAWTPDASQIGSHLVVFTAEDDLGFQAPICTITITVLPGNYDARGFGATLVADDASLVKTPASHVRDEGERAFARVPLPVGNITAVAFDFDGEAGFPDGTSFAGHAVANSVAGVIDIPGVLYAEGVSMRAESVVDDLGAESWSDLRFAKLRIGTTEVELGDVSGPREYRVPGVATVRVHEEIDTGDGKRNANLTAHAFHVIFERPSPVRELYLVGATATVGLNVVPGDDATNGVQPGAQATDPDCVGVSGRLDPARLVVGPLVIDGDLDLVAKTGGTLMLRDLDIYVPPGEQGVVVTNTTLPLTLRNVRFHGDQILGGGGSGGGKDPAFGSHAATREFQWPDGVEDALRAQGFDPDALRPRALLPALDAEGGAGATASASAGAAGYPWAGLVLDHAGPVVVTTSRFEGMRAGIVAIDGRAPSVACSLFVGQSAAGIAILEGGQQGTLDAAPDALAITNSVFRGNGTTASVGVYADAPPTLLAITLEGNRFADLGWGGMWIEGWFLTWSEGRVALAGNVFENLGGAALSIDPAIADGVVAIDGNVVLGGHGGLAAFYGELVGTTLDVTGNLIENNSWGGVDLWRGGRSITARVSDNTLALSGWSLFGAWGPVAESRIVAAGNVLVGNDWGGFDFWSNVYASDIAFASNVGAANAWGAFEFWGGVETSAIRLLDNVIADSAWSTADWWSYIYESTISMNGNTIADLLADAAQHSGVTFWGFTYGGDIDVAGNAFLAHSGHGLAFVGRLGGTPLSVAQNAFVLNAGSGVHLGGGEIGERIVDDPQGVVIERNAFTANGVGINAAGGFGDFVGAHNAFVANGIGAMLQPGFSGSLSANTFAENDYGIYAYYAYGAIVRDNLITRSTTAGAYADGAELDARENWWGSHDGPSGIGPGAGDAVLGAVMFDPWHATPVEAVVGSVTP